MNVPKDWRQVTLKQYQEVVEIALIDMDEIDKQVKILSILCNIDEDKILDLPIPSIKDYSNKIKFIYSLPEPEKIFQSVKIKGQRFNVNLSVSKLSGGEYIDLSNYCKEQKEINSNLHNIISIFLHPVNILGLRKKDCYSKNAKGEWCQKLESRNRTSELIKSLTMDKVFSLSGFFLTLSENLIKVTMDYSIAEVNKTNKKIAKQLKRGFKNIGVGS